MANYKFYYFPIRGRGEAIKYIFAYTNTPYEDEVVSVEQWMAGVKESTLFFKVYIFALNKKDKMQTLHFTLILFELSTFELF
jgi:hypothetical protein